MVLGADAETKTEMKGGRLIGEMRVECCKKATSNMNG